MGIKPDKTSVLNHDIYGDKTDFYGDEKLFQWWQTLKFDLKDI